MAIIDTNLLYKPSSSKDNQNIKNFGFHLHDRGDLLKPIQQNPGELDNDYKERVLKYSQDILEPFEKELTDIKDFIQKHPYWRSKTILYKDLLLVYNTTFLKVVSQLRQIYLMQTGHHFRELVLNVVGYNLDDLFK